MRNSRREKENIGEKKEKEKGEGTLDFRLRMVSVKYKMIQ